MRACWLVGLLALLCAAAAQAAAPPSYPATVSYVSDGDTLWVEPADGGPRRKLRLLGLDAPEICQAGGAAARAALTRRVLHQRVQVAARYHDDYGRDLARVQLHGEDLGAWLVRSGHAWSDGYRRHAGPYAQEERAARAARRGLFAEPSPEPPRVFRRRHGPCGQGPAVPDKGR